MDKVTDANNLTYMNFVVKSCRCDFETNLSKADRSALRTRRDATTFVAGITLQLSKNNLRLRTKQNVSPHPPADGWIAQHQALQAWCQ